MAKNTTSESAAEPVPQALIEQILAKARGFRDRDKALLAEQIQLEQAGIRPAEPQSGPDARELAATLLNGHALPKDKLPTPGETLHGIKTERAAIVFALEALESRENQARIMAVAEVMRETEADWLEIVRQRAMALLTLRRVNAEAAGFREKVRRLAKANPNLICDVVSGPLFGPPVVGDHAYVFLQACERAGIITRKEIDDAD
ncbi:hypothetical protein EFV37_13190 [Mesorhizobium loti]|uniref:Uncharacterized protein n=1 Tax=Mesorhizobium jarvisii TaxID=1777867 RepID=A0A6M7TEK1_9HYPH|nr:MULTISPECIES: hypothetical protein [Mesorhizobium]OBQ58037.1 hypothetical protein A9K72_27930 [Mesorhizobium loti]QKC63149.1 hypothetical protein EB229_13180 [Mesorhizobium jarvisii]QKD09060.1 hypothetical protein EFV37_13190 [Mesorhizobium loti]RJT30156.1 hypothetical protein D3242_25915 [Mesorhizobium jarvisii]